MATEKVVVSLPGVPSQVIDVEVRASEGDDDIARRLAPTFPVGTLLSVSGVKWRVVSQSPPEVAEVGVPQPVLALVDPPKDGPQPGERWRPRDPRRKSGFTIKAVTETEVIADDGRTVSLDRLKRYERVS